MAKAVADPQTVALAALAQALADPASRLLITSGKNAGFFKGATQAIKSAARLCEERQWLAGTGEWIGKGASKKQKYRLTPAGVQAVLDHGDALMVLRALQNTLQEQAALFGGLRDQLGRLVDHLRPLTDTVAQLARRIEPPNVEQLLRKLAPSAATAPAPPPATDGGQWLNDVVRLVTQQRERDRYQPLTLPQLFAALKPARPGLTLGQFHDGLRLLRDQGRIRLTPFTRALATIDDGRNALFLDGEVMYYAELP